LMYCWLCGIMHVEWWLASAWVSGCRLGMTQAASKGWGGTPMLL